MRRKHEHDLDEKLSSSESGHLTQLARLHGGLGGLLAALEARAEGDRAAVAAQELWLACVAMEAAIRAGREGAASWEESVRPLSQEVSAVKVRISVSPVFRTPGKSGEKIVFFDILKAIEEKSRNHIRIWIRKPVVRKRGSRILNTGCHLSESLLS